MNNISPIFSVLMVTYNSSQFVNEAINSILNSSFEDFELIISDDHSNDETWYIINTFKDKRIISHRNNVNIGEYNNRNVALSMATGKFILFIDGDDMIYPHGLSVLNYYVNILPDCGLYLMRWYKKNIFYPVVIEPKDFYTGIYFNYGLNNIAFSNTLIRREFLAECGGLPINYISGDDYIRLKLGSKYKTALLVDGLTWWRETPNQASSKKGLVIEKLLNELSILPFFLKENPNLFNSDEINIAKKNLEINLFREIISLIKKFNFIYAYKIIKHFNLNPLRLIQYRKKIIFKDPFEKSSPLNPASYYDFKN